MLTQTTYTELWRIYRKDYYHFFNLPFLLPTSQIYSSVNTWVSQRTPTSPVMIFWNAPPRNPNERYVGGKCILGGSGTTQVTDSESHIRNLDDKCCCCYSFSYRAGFPVSWLTGLSKKGGSTFFHDYKLLSTVIRRRIHYLTVPLLYWALKRRQTGL